MQRVNAGNTTVTPLFVDGQGNSWAADKAFVTGSWGYVSGSAKSYTTAVVGTTDDALYQKLREGMTSYKFTVSPGGPYKVTLRFTEFSASAVGKRGHEDHHQRRGSGEPGHLPIGGQGGRATTSSIRRPRGRMG